MNSYNENMEKVACWLLPLFVLHGVGKEKEGSSR